MYFMPFLDIRIVLRFEVEFNRYLAVAHNIRQGPWIVMSATDHINVGTICYYGLRVDKFPQYQKISNNWSTVRELFSFGRIAISTTWLFFYAAGVRSWCKILENFLFMFIPHRIYRPTYTISISKEPDVLNKIILISDVPIKKKLQ